MLPIESPIECIQEASRCEPTRDHASFQKHMLSDIKSIGISAKVDIGNRKIRCAWIETERRCKVGEHYMWILLGDNIGMLGDRRLACFAALWKFANLEAAIPCGSR
eukprot:1192931-Prorocentrum_minimum.AAC.6